MTDERRPHDWFGSRSPEQPQATSGLIPPAQPGGSAHPVWGTPPPAAPYQPSQTWPLQAAAPQPRLAGRRRWAGAGLVAAGVVAGGVLAGTLAASAASNGATSTTAATSYASTGYSSAGSDTTGSESATRGSESATGPVGGSTPVRGDEKALSLTLTATLTQKAQTAVPGGTVYRVEADSGDAAYEAHMTKADGMRVTVKFDTSGTVTAVEDGMGK